MSIRALRTSRCESGITIVEVLFCAALMGTLTAIAVPCVGGALDDLRAAGAARYVAGRVMSLRMEAIRRSSAIALRFEVLGDDYVYAAFVDGNGNGVRTADIRAGIDRPLGAFERLRDKFPGVRFELCDGAREVDGGAAVGTDGVRIGTARILTMSPDGTATAGTLYIRGAREQYAVRILGVTGRTRVLQYDAGARTWMTR